MQRSTSTQKDGGEAKLTRTLLSRFFASTVSLLAFPPSLRRPSTPPFVLALDNPQNAHSSLHASFANQCEPPPPQLALPRHLSSLPLPSFSVSTLPPPASAHVSRTYVDTQQDVRYLKPLVEEVEAEEAERSAFDHATRA